VIKYIQLSIIVQKFSLVSFSQRLRPSTEWYKNEGPLWPNGQNNLESLGDGRKVRLMGVVLIDQNDYLLHYFEARILDWWQSFTPTDLVGQAALRDFIITFSESRWYYVFMSSASFTTPFFSFECGVFFLSLSLSLYHKL
jgi:hypothetical protein